jgi:hypothetical protein
MMTDNTSAPADRPTNSPFHQPLKAGVAAPGAEPRTPSADQMAFHQASPDERSRMTQEALSDRRGEGPGHVHTRAADGTPLIDGKPAAEFNRPPGVSSKPDQQSANSAPGDGDRQANKAGEPFVRFADGSEHVLSPEMSARLSGMLSAPETPEGYTTELPKDFQAPQGLKVEFNQDNPSLKAFRAAAKDIGLSQDQFSRLLGVYAGEQVVFQQTLKTAREAEIGKLGAAASARMSAINTFLVGHLGDADAKALQDSIWTAAAVKSWERLITQLANSHGSAYSQSNRDGGSNGVDDKTYESWSYNQRANYARTGDPNKAV